MSEQQQVNLTEQTFVLDFHQGVIGNRRQIARDSISTEQENRDAEAKALIVTEVDKASLYVSKELFDSPELKQVHRHAGATRSQVRMMSLPSFYRAGMYLVKMDATKAVDEKLAEAQAKHQELVEEFIKAIPARKEEAKTRLGAAYEEGDYPTDSQVRKAFRWEWKWLTLATPSKLKQISQALFEREARKAQESLESAVKNIETLLAAEVKVFVDRLVDRLTPGPDGQKKVFRNTLTTNISEFVAAYPLRNLGSSKALDDVMGKMGKLLDGIDPESLRDNAKLAEDLKSGFEAVQATLTTMAKPERILELED